MASHRSLLAEGSLHPSDAERPARVDVGTARAVARWIEGGVRSAEPGASAKALAADEVAVEGRQKGVRRRLHDVNFRTKFAAHAHGVAVEVAAARARRRAAAQRHQIDGDDAAAGAARRPQQAAKEQGAFDEPAYLITKIFINIIWTFQTPL